MASITKVMTAVVALESGIDLDTEITLSGCSLDANAMIAGYQAGQTSTLRNLLKVMLVYSANDAAYEIAVACAGSQDAFVERMNEKAQELGMTHTNYVNPHGLDAEGHHSCVSDLAILAQYAMKNYSFISDTVTLEEVTAPVGSIDVTFPTVDAFLTSYDGALGIKTGLGNTTACFLGCARRNAATLYTCVLGCETSAGRFADTIALMNWAFSLYEKESFESSVPQTTAPFAYHFGLSCSIESDGATIGLIWPEGTSVSQTTIGYDQGSFVEPGQTYSATQWTQDDRVLATTTASTSNKLVQSRSGLGLVDTFCSLYDSSWGSNLAA